MKKFFLLGSLLVFSSLLTLKAQVGINTDNPDPSAILDISGSNGGLLPPRLTAIQRNAITSPASGLVIYNTDTKSLETYNGTKWISIGSSGSNWFYMPVTPLDVTLNKEYTKDLYGAYRKQFTGAILGGGGAANLSPYAASELEFLLLGYDTSVFPKIVLSASGILTYTPNSSAVSDSTYINVVFRVK